MNRELGAAHARVAERRVIFNNQEWVVRKPLWTRLANSKLPSLYPQTQPQAFQSRTQPLARVNLMPCRLQMRTFLINQRSCLAVFLVEFLRRMPLKNATKGIRWPEYCACKPEALQRLGPFGVGKIPRSVLGIIQEGLDTDRIGWGEVSPPHHHDYSWLPGHAGHRDSRCGQRQVDVREDRDGVRDARQGEGRNRADLATNE